MYLVEKMLKEIENDLDAILCEKKEKGLLIPKKTMAKIFYVENNIFKIKRYDFKIALIEEYKEILSRFFEKKINNYAKDKDTDYRDLFFLLKQPMDKFLTSNIFSYSFINVHLFLNVLDKYIENSEIKVNEDNNSDIETIRHTEKMKILSNIYNNMFSYDEGSSSYHFIVESILLDDKDINEVFYSLPPSKIYYIFSLFEYIENGLDEEIDIENNLEYQRLRDKILDIVCNSIYMNKHGEYYDKDIIGILKSAASYVKEKHNLTIFDKKIFKEEYCNKYITNFLLDKIEKEINYETGDSISFSF